MNSKTALIIVGVIVILGGVLFYANSKSNTPADVSSPASTTESSKTNTSDNIVATSPSGPSGPSASGDSSTPGDEIVDKYLVYSEDALKTAQDNGQALLFFHADWCPTCRVADKSIKEDNDQLPKGVTILKTDYDTEKGLKDKYNVVVQHTFVLVDKNGDEVTQWRGGGIETIVSNLENPL